jgi:hypothetical protein
VKRLREAIIRSWLLDGYQWAAARIASGDLDFDDVIYVVRDATARLLDIYFDADPRTTPSNTRQEAIDSD